MVANIRVGLSETKDFKLPVGRNEKSSNLGSLNPLSIPSRTSKLPGKFLSILTERPVRGDMEDLPGHD
jgi:hypothetical protein